MSFGSQTPKEGRDGILPEGWAALSPLVNVVLDAPVAEREARIVELSNGDASRADALRALVADCERDTPPLDVPAPEQFAGLIADEPEQPLPELLGDRYRIARELGRGGMARVFLALDTKHDRHVAVKVIRPDLAASLGRERFLREIAIAARLRHPNIVPLYDSGDADGVLYFVMPYEEGQSLRQRLDQQAPLVASEYVGVLRDVARALAYAHEHGVVHRDIKPDNVMLSGGAVVVADFGIAKAVSVAQGSTGNTTTLTQTGSGIGTPTYMAPEQAVGDPASDHRADIYAFGCLAYELISGKPPFHDLPVHQLIAAHVAVVPTAIGSIKPDVNERLASLVMQCLAKEPADRPQTATALLEGLEGTATDEQLRASRVDLSAKRIHTGRLVALAAAIVAVGVVLFLLFRANVDPPPLPDVTVAVLPLQSSSDDPQQRAIAEGLSDEVATQLFRVPGIHVMSRRGVANYRDQRELNTDKLGRALGARFLVMGTLREVDGRLRVLASLVRASDNTLLWSDQFDRAQNELSVVRNEIVRAIGDTLSKLVPASARIGRRRVGRPERVENPEAYRLYLLAQRALERRGNSIQASVDNFAQAVAIDSNYADAWAGLSLARALTPLFTKVTALAVEPAVRAAATRALSLDSTLAAPHVALGLAHQHAFRWDSATIEYQTAVRLRSAGDVEPLIQYGRHLMFRGRVGEAMRQLMIARQTEPASAVVAAWLGYGYYLDGQLDSAVVEIRRAYQSDSTHRFLVGVGPVILQRAGLPSEARRQAERVWPERSELAWVLAAQGDSAPAFALLRRREHADDWRLMLVVGDTTRALQTLERLTSPEAPWPTANSVLDPQYAVLWPSARFRAVLQRVGLGDVVLPTAGKH